MTEDKASVASSIAKRSGLFLLFLICGVSLPSLSGLLIFPFSMIPLSWDWAYRIALSTAFLLLSLVSSKTGTYKGYWKIFFSFFIASFALNLQAVSGFFNFHSTPINNIVLSMLSSTLLVVIPIIALSLGSGDNLSTIFLTRGNLKRGLLIGSIGFIAFTLVSIPAATYLFGGKDLTVAKAIGWTLPLLVTVFANGFREELLYRGLFLKKYGPLIGSRCSNLLQAIIFSLSHTVAGRGAITYTPYMLALVLFTLVLGLVWGFVMQKTNGILGSVLFHAGSDVSVFLGIFSNLL